MRILLFSLLCLLSGCASARPVPKMNQCWPDGDSMKCIDVNGNSYIADPIQLKDLVCYPAEQIKIYNEACHK